MNTIEQLGRLLPCERFARSDDISDALAQLGAYGCETFRSFYENFRGPVGGNSMGYQILDIIEDHPSIITATYEIRSLFSLEEKWLVVSDLFANAALFYDTSTDRVFDVDFEQGIKLLIANQKKESWESFDAFLRFFFQIDSAKS
jgi:hypothetical protein